ncbi:MAG: type II toxin-antitoxin system mRNA interferase toxin, RelE/StbE family [Candidatus Yanofskybacteria bacterium]|nr:type II toxin-antitoxin system mRNA interferase toxin, RelE/StbE family [Candidatus Yanofskybacteria bacterium]
MRVVFTRVFLKSAKDLPDKIQNKLDTQTALLEQNIFHPLLHTKQLSADLSGFYSFRITRDYRVIFQLLSPDTVQLIRVANRKDIYR